MANGVQVWRADGKVLVSTDKRMGRIMGVYGATGPGSITIPALSQGTPWAIVQDKNGLREAYLTITISGTTISWTQTSMFSQSVDALIYYGIY